MSPEIYNSGRPQLIWRRLVSDMETPVSAYLKLSQRASPSFLLESVEGGAVRGRYSMIGLEPDLIWTCRDGKAQINRSPRTGAFTPLDGHPLEELRRLLADSAIAVPEGLPPMSAGVFGYLGYDMVRQMEHLPDTPPDSLDLPDAILIRPTLMVVFDAVRDEMTLVTPVRPHPEVTAQTALAWAESRLDELEALLHQPVQSPPVSVQAASPVPVSNTSPDAYMAMVDKAKDYILAGDIFQVVLSQRFEAPFELPPFALYRALRRVNPAPFLCYLQFEGFSIVCSSPEILVRVRDGTVTIRPIAGTRPRGATPEQDQALAKELLADPKERAEHLMLLDLGRNDVGRVARTGTMAVTSSFFLEYYSQVMHIVSNVEGELDTTRADALAALCAGFPAGTVSGAPKVRAMQIIDELEQTRRGPYGGCIGYFGAGGEMDSCIVLRTAIVKDRRMYVQAGAGIVYDSVAESEQQECVNKARALFRAAEEAVRFAALQGHRQ